MLDRIVMSCGILFIFIIFAVLTIGLLHLLLNVLPNLWKDYTNAHHLRDQLEKLQKSNNQLKEENKQLSGMRTHR